MWLLTSVDDLAATEATSHLLEAPQYHEWTLHDLSIIWRTLLGRGQVRPLLRGFELFQRVSGRKRTFSILLPVEQMLALPLIQPGLETISVFGCLSGLPPGVGAEDVRVVL